VSDRTGRNLRTRVAAGAVLALLALLASACGSDPARGTAGPLVVAAASDLLPAFTLLGEEFERTTGHRVVFSFGSSGLLAQQLIEGAPMDVYASASANFVDRVLAAGVGDPATRTTYAFGRLVIWSTPERWSAADGWDTLTDVALDPDVRSVAIANPEHAPYGSAARQALEQAGVAGAIGPRLVFGENVTDAQRLVATGNADVGIIALSLATAADAPDGPGVGGRWVLIDEALHAPLQQELIVIARDDERAAVARAFVAFLASSDGRTVMRRSGFLLPGDAADGTTGPASSRSVR